MQPIAVLGSGSWGTALAWLLGEKGLEVRLWARDPEQAARIGAERRNARYLPGLTLPPSVLPSADLPACLEGASLLVLAVPTQALRETLRAVSSQQSAVSSQQPSEAEGRSHSSIRNPQSAIRNPQLVIAAKGLERDTGLRVTEVALEELGAEAAPRVAVLSGPNLSGEVVRRVPTATVVAAPDEGFREALQDTFGTGFFRVYTNGDVIGVELGGALKNPIAIAAGISDGLGFGDNTKATLLTRGLAEMVRLGTAAGGRPETFSGLSGLGDLMATAHSPLSRNYRLGLALGRGDTLEHARESLHQVAEGVPTTGAACRLALRLGVEVPILQELRAVLYEGRPVAEAVGGLMSRPYRDEG